MILQKLLKKLLKDKLKDDTLKKLKTMHFVDVLEKMKKRHDNYDEVENLFAKFVKIIK